MLINVKFSFGTVEMICSKKRIRNLPFTSVNKATRTKVSHTISIISILQYYYLFN